MRTRVTAAAFGALLVLALAGCTTPEPTEPTPTPTFAFATEEEAFAAAEETYRAYVDASNARRVDPTAEPDPLDYLIGAALESDIDAELLQRQNGLSINGPTIVVDVEGREYDPDGGQVSISVCIDVRQARVVDEQGADVTSADRGDRASLDVELVTSGGYLLIEESDLAVDQPC